MFSLKQTPHLIFTIAMILAIAGCATTPKKHGAKDNLLKDICEQHGIEMQADTVSQVVTLKSQKIKAQVLVGSNIVIINDEKIYLSQPVKIVKSAIIVPEDFQLKIIERFKLKPQEKVEVAFPKIKRVIIDAGHGGKDPGAIGRSGLKEKDVVLDVSQKVRNILLLQGIDVVMTRDEDIFISLQERTEIATRQKGDLFVSIHANSHPAHSVQGVEVYRCRELNLTDKNEEQRRMNHSILFKNLKMKSQDANVESIVTDLMYKHKQSESIRLAHDVAHKTARETQARNLGPKESGFFVLRNTLVPAVLVEIGFLSHHQEEKLLNTDFHRQKVADGIAKSILDYAEIKFK